LPNVSNGSAAVTLWKPQPCRFLRPVPFRPAH
jgi:hypothetical protein